MSKLLSIVFLGIKQRGIQVLLLLTFYLCLAKHLPPEVHQILYTCSVFIKDLLVWLLPVTVGFFIANTICSFQKRALLFVISLLVFEALSNLSSVWYAFASGHLALDYLPSIKLSSIDERFDPLWRLPLIKPVWWSADKGTLFGLALGFLVTIKQNTLLKQWIHQGKEAAQWALTRVFSRLIPLYVLGFVARMHQTQAISHVLGHYGVLLIWLVAFLLVYLAALFLLGSGGSFQTALKATKNLLPAGGISFTSGCSLSTMPWTIEGTGRNLQNPDFAKAVIPATTNIQQVGDCIANSFLCFLIYTHAFGHSPNLITWTAFSIVFVLARFATAAVIGGAIFIMLPIYETYLSFNAEMIAVILAFNVILDPLITCTNVVGNGALCRIFEKIWLLLPSKAPAPHRYTERDSGIGS